MYKKLLMAAAVLSLPVTADAAANRPKNYKTICKTGQTCSVSSNTRVAFGASGKFVYKNLSGSFSCSVNTFGKDPLPSKKRKECSIPKNSSGGQSSGSSNNNSSNNNSSNNSSSNNSSSNNSSSSGSRNYEVRARGISGSERISLKIGGSTVKSWTLSTGMRNYSASSSRSGDVKIAFTNDGGGKDVQVDYVSVNGSRRQSENQSQNSGAWGNGRCGGAGRSEWLHCNGEINYGNAGGGGSSNNNSNSNSNNNSSNNSNNNSNNNQSSNSGGNNGSRKSGCGSSPRGTVRLSSTKRISGSFDGGCKEYIATFGDGSQKEGQDPVIRVDGGNVRNVFVGPNGDGIHIRGNTTLTNITWRDVGEDALSVKANANVTISNFEAYNASDKVFQLNARTTFKARNCTVRNMGKMFRENGGKCYPVNVSVENCYIEKASDAVFRSDCSRSSWKISKSTVKNAKVCYKGTANCDSNPN